MSVLSGRPVNWNVLAATGANPEGTASQLAASTAAEAAGGRVVALTLPHTMDLRLSFEHGAILDGLPGWGEFFARPVEERIGRARRPGGPPGARRAGPSRTRPASSATWPTGGAWSSVRPRPREPRRSRGCPWPRWRRERGLDAVGRHLPGRWWRTGSAPGSRYPSPTTDDDWAARARTWRDPRALVGGSDAGAHLDTMCGAVYSTTLLAEGVRRRGLVTLEEAVRMLTEAPARLYGVIDRGRVAEGYRADLVVFDPERVGPGPLRTRDDLPGGASRLYAGATGMEHVLVNGTEVVTHDMLTGALPGTVLRSGTDTRTVTVSGGA